MENKPFIHPSRAHLFQKPPISDDTFKQTQNKHVGQTWNNRRDKQRDTQADDQLLVFGYASKIFPPDKQSAAIAKNKHMIAWNEDYRLNLLIDRYDCRASLHNLSEFDGDTWNKNYQLSEEDVKLEAHLDEERYRALFVEELEEDIRHEEELKRLHASIAQDETGGAGAEVAYSYEEEEEEAGEQYDPTEPTNDEESIQKLFTAPTSLAVPKDMEIPQTEKVHAIIQKTALFVSKQGTQMEIVLKAKQANNTQFLFLQFDHYLNPYYKHMVERIKEGKYTPGTVQEEKKDEEEESSEEDSDSDGGYLHPSLFASAHKTTKPEQDEKTKAIRTVDPDHPLAKLIEKGRQANAIKQYQRMAEAVYNYYQQQGSVGEPTTTNSLEPPPLPTFMTMSGIHPAPATSASGQLPNPADATQQQAAADSTSLEDVAWKSDAEIVPPPPDLQAVVEEIAKKVAVEGKETEKALICRADANYTFLNPWHELHPYYQFRKMSWIRVLNPPPPPEPTAKSGTDDESHSSEENEEETADDKAKAAVAPISFSIKTKKENLTKPALAPSNTTAVLGDVPSEEDGEVEDQEKVETKKMKLGRRMFTDKPPPPPVAASDAAETSVEVEQETSAISEKTTPEPAQEEIPAETLKKPSANVSVGLVKPSSVAKPQPVAPVSTFTAVTSTGEAASISDLREKQAARRRKALLFLKAKTEAENNKAASDNAVKNSITDEQSKLAAIASEDIFDLSSPAENEASNSPAVVKDCDQDSSFASEKSDEKSFRKSSSSSDSSNSDSSPSSRRSRSRSGSVSKYHVKSRHLAALQSQTRSIISDLERLTKRSENPDSSSSSEGSFEMPSAYRVQSYKKKSSTKSASARKRSRKRSVERSSKRHKRSRGEKSPSLSKPKRRFVERPKKLHKHSSRDKKSKKRKKKTKKTKKHKRSRSSSSSSSSISDIELAKEVISGLYADDQDFAIQRLNRLSKERLIRHEDSDSDDEFPFMGHDVIDGIIDERSEGEIVSD